MMNLHLCSVANNNRYVKNHSPITKKVERKVMQSFGLFSNIGILSPVDNFSALQFSSR